MVIVTLKVPSFTMTSHKGSTKTRREPTLVRMATRKEITVTLVGNLWRAEPSYTPGAKTKQRVKQLPGIQSLGMQSGTFTKFP